MRIDDLDLTAPELIADPYPVLADLRAQAPMAWHEPSGMFLAFGYHAANAVLRDRRAGRLWRDRQPRERFEPFNALHRHQMMENEPPKHTRLRGLVAKAFARGHVERLRPRVTEMAGELLDRVDGSAGFDLLADFAGPLPVMVIAELLGVPAEDRHLLRPWSNAIVKMYEYHRPAELEDRAVTAAIEFADYLRVLAKTRRARPENDLISHLAAIEDGGTRLSEDELVASAILLLNAGHEASVNVLGNGMVALLDHPTERDRLVTEPELVAPAVEEMIRYDAPLHLFERTATADLVIAGAPVAGGGGGGGVVGWG
jgi:cytochrome P450